LPDQPLEKYPEIRLGSCPNRSLQQCKQSVFSNRAFQNGGRKN